MVEVAAAPMPSARAPRPPASPDVPPWPRGEPSLRPAEPAGGLDDALGRHLEQLGRALQARELRCPPVAGDGVHGAGADEDEGASLRAALEGDGEVLLQALCSDTPPEESYKIRVVQQPADEKRRNEDTGWEDLFERSSADQHDSGKVAGQDGLPALGDEHPSARPPLCTGSTPSSAVGSVPPNPSTRASGRGNGILSTKQRLMPMTSSLEKIAKESATHDDIVASLSGLRRQAGGESWLTRLVLHSYFDMVFAILLTVNTLVIIIEEQYLGSKAGYSVRFYESYGSNSYNATFFPGGDDVFIFLEYAFTSIFMVEAALRMTVLRRKYFVDPYELLDLFVVVCSIISILSQAWESMNVQIFRLLRTTKVLRMIKLIRRIQGFDSLHLMTAALSASGYALVWASMLLFLMQSVVALILTNLLRSQYLLFEGKLDSGQKEELFEYFGTYARSMLSMFELTLANWPPICRFLTENLHESWMIFAVVYKLSFGFAVVGVINAVFVQETFNVATTDDSIMVKRKLRAANIHRTKMEKLFRRADADGSGMLDNKKFRKVLQDKSIQTWLESMDLDASNSDLIFNLIKKDSKNTISVDELILGVARLKGTARSIDVQMVIRALQEHWAPENQFGSHRGVNSALRDARNFLSNVPN